MQKIGIARIMKQYIIQRKQFVELQELKAEAAKPFIKEKVEQKNSALYNYYQTNSGQVVKNRY